MIFIKELKKQSLTLNYLWKAETQKNGNIHFHIIIDEFIDKKIIERIWLNRMAALGYLSDYKKKTGKSNPPCTNVESLRDKTSSGAYVAKYIRKDEGERQVVGRCWGCGDKIRALQSPEIQVRADEFDTFFQNIDFSKSKINITEYYVVVNQVKGIDEVVERAIYNNYYDSKIKHNCDLIYCINYRPYLSDRWSVWEQEIIDEFNEARALQMYEQGLIDW